MDRERPDGAVNNNKNLHSEVPVSSNKQFYPSLEFYFADRCDIIDDMPYDILLPCFLMNNIQNHKMHYDASRQQRGSA